MSIDTGPTVTINGTPYALPTDPRTTLLDFLHQNLALFGTKKGCDHGQCGACTVLVDDERINACLVFAFQLTGKSITTIEGIAKNDELHPLQRAFVNRDAFQCGYCTPGQISSAHAMLAEYRRGDLSMSTFDGSRADVLTGCTRLTHAEIRERMAGNICRCGAYANIVEAIDIAAECDTEDHTA